LWRHAFKNLPKRDHDSKAEVALSIIPVVCALGRRATRRFRPAHGHDVAALVGELGALIRFATGKRLLTTKRTKNAVFGEGFPALPQERPQVFKIGVKRKTFGDDLVTIPQSSPVGSSPVADLPTRFAIPQPLPLGQSFIKLLVFFNAKLIDSLVLFVSMEDEKATRDKKNEPNDGRLNNQ
jgi:hypothetical protein